MDHVQKLLCSSFVPPPEIDETRPIRELIMSSLNGDEMAAKTAKVALTTRPLDGLRHHQYLKATKRLVLRTTAGSGAVGRTRELQTTLWLAHHAAIENLKNYRTESPKKTLFRSSSSCASRTLQMIVSNTPLGMMRSIPIGTTIPIMLRTMVPMQ